MQFWITRSARLLVTLLAIACTTRTSAPVTTSVEPRVVSEEPSTLVTTTGNLEGTLEFPATRLPVPLVLIIAGSGPTDRNGNTSLAPSPNNSLKMLADGLSARGIASLRYDKRGVAASKASVSNSEDLRFSTFADDGSAWVSKFRHDHRFSMVIVAGHSEGSLIGMIASKSAKADGFVSIEGAGRPAQDVIREQLAARLPPRLLSAALRILDSLVRGERADSVPASLNALFRPDVQPYLISWFRYSPAQEVAKLRMPVLIIQGSTDIQVPLSDARLLGAAAPSAKVVIVEGMNHILKDVASDPQLNLRSYSDPSLPIDATLLDAIAEFVHAIDRKNT